MPPARYTFYDSYIMEELRQRASGVGNLWGLKPVKKRAAPASHTRLTARVL
jgi:hypothetical protein